MNRELVTIEQQIKALLRVYRAAKKLEPSFPRMVGPLFQRLEEVGELALAVKDAERLCIDSGDDGW